MEQGSEVELPSGADLAERWKAMSAPAQGEISRQIRKGETSENRDEAALIAALTKQRLNGWTLRPEIVLPAFIGLFFILSLVIENFSFTSSLTAPVIYAGYLIVMRKVYSRSYDKSMEVLRRSDAGA